MPASFRARWRCVVLLVLFCLAGTGAAATSSDTRAYRLFLRDGTAVAIHGEFARVGDRVVFTIAVGGGDPPRLQAVSLAASAIDWAKTDEYTLAIRAAYYADTRGEADYAALSVMVARTLSDLRLVPDPSERVRMVERLRATLADWSLEHYAYRAADVRQVQDLVDEVLSEQRVAAGLTRFDLNLVANVEPPKTVLLPALTPAEAIAQVLSVAKVADVATDRRSLLLAALAAVDRTPDLPDTWAKRTRDETARTIAAEAVVDASYAEMRRTALARAQAAAAHADADGVGHVLASIRDRDQRLGRRRPEDVEALMAAIQRWQDEALRLRLARDRWRLELPGRLEYERLLRMPTAMLEGQRRTLEAIKKLDGPDPAALAELRRRVERARDLIAQTPPPAGLEPVHATLSSACQLAMQSADTRERAIRTGDTQLAWDASSAAAGASQLLARAREQLEAALRRPALK